MSRRMSDLGTFAEIGIVPGVPCILAGVEGTVATTLADKVSLQH
jgi:hypothetical protein